MRIEDWELDPIPNPNFMYKIIHIKFHLIYLIFLSLINKKLLMLNYKAIIISKIPWNFRIFNAFEDKFNICSPKATIIIYNKKV